MPLSSDEATGLGSGLNDDDRLSFTQRLRFDMLDLAVESGVGGDEAIRIAASWEKFVLDGSSVMPQTITLDESICREHTDLTNQIAEADRRCELSRLDVLSQLGGSESNPK